MTLKKTATVPTTPRTASLSVEIELEEPPEAAAQTDFELIRVGDGAQAANWDFVIWEAT